jgi:pimeloyl-ACP methyl ester carboxylesterase
MAMATTNRSGVTIFYREVGEGEPVLLIQGLEVDNRGWAAQVPALRQKFRCISFDNRDIGQSEFVPGGYRISDMAADAVGVLDELGIEKAHVVGFSMGGAIAQEFALTYPERLNKLALIGTFVWMDERFQQMNRARANIRGKLSLEDYTRANFPTVYTSRDYAVPGLVEGIIQRVLENAAIAQPNEAFTRQITAILAYDGRERIQDISAPTLVICGDEDYLCPPAQSKLLADTIPNARLELIPEAGHGVIWTRADEVNPLLMSFLGG